MEGSLGRGRGTRAGALLPGASWDFAFASISLGQGSRPLFSTVPSGPLTTVCFVLSHLWGFGQ